MTFAAGMGQANEPMTISSKPPGRITQAIERQRLIHNRMADTWHRAKAITNQHLGPRPEPGMDAGGPEKPPSSMDELDMLQASCLDMIDRINNELVNLEEL